MLQEATSQHTTSSAPRAGWSKPVIAALNRHKRLIQWGLAILGLLLVALSLPQIPSMTETAGRFYERTLQRGFNGVAKPTEWGIWLVAGLYAVRMSFKYEHDYKELGRAALRFLQVIHIPLATVLLVAAAIHGALYSWYLWRSDFNYWSGIVAMASMLGVSLLGLGAIKGRKYRSVHLVTGLVSTALIAIHIFL